MKRMLPSSFVTWRKCFCLSHPSIKYASQNQTTGETIQDDNLTESLEQDFSPYKRIPYLHIDLGEISVDDVMKEKVKFLQTEVYLLSERGAEVPQRIKPKQWMKLLEINSLEARTQYLHSLYVSEQIKQDKKKTRTVRKMLYLEDKERSEQIKGPIMVNDNKKYVKYGLNFNTLFRGLYTTEMNKYYYYRLWKAMMFGPNIVVDCGYDKAMSEKEILKCAKDILQMWQENKVHANPFSIHFCNVQEGNLLLQKLKDLFLSLEEHDLPFHYTSQSYLNLFDKKKLVYLTPYSSRNLQCYDHDTVYVVGALMNNSSRGALSLAKAKKEGLRTAKFPIRRFVDWNFGSSSLKSSQALAIMNDLKEQHDWKTIFTQHLPVTKTPQEVLQEKKDERTWKKIASHFGNSF